MFNDIDIKFIKKNAPCYIYDKSMITERCRVLQNAMPEALFLYSIKTNPFLPVIKTVAGEGFGADAASSGEVLKASEAGIPPERIYYSSPGKTLEDIERVFGKCVIIADSLSELKMLNDYATAKGETCSAGIRINPLFTMDGEAPFSSKFGIDEELLTPESLDFPNIKITGIHIHLKSQILDAATLCRYYENCFDLGWRINAIPGVCIEFINFGSGIGTVYDKACEAPLDFDRIALTVKKLAKQNEATLRGKLIFETGRFLVCNAGTYYTKIADKKVSRGRTYLIVENGLNGFLRPAVAQLLRNNMGSYPETGQEPLYTSPGQCSFSLPERPEDGEKEIIDIAGNLCTSLDVMAEGITLPVAETGDIVAVTNAGSYGLTLSPAMFSSHRPPKEFLL